MTIRFKEVLLYLNGKDGKCQPAQNGPMSTMFKLKLSLITVIIKSVPLHKLPHPLYNVRISSEIDRL